MSLECPILPRFSDLDVSVWSYETFFLLFRLIGLCLLQNELCPLFLNRHVIKYILGRPIRFHDLAFFDSVIYESLRQLVIDAETKDSNSLFSALDLTFRFRHSFLSLFPLNLFLKDFYLHVHDTRDSNY